ncbi:hypothetical protein [Candidatus Lokiarchaeum ossiferum]|uniref:hypothetical protein n=1 Tax=Candidatus Lokiarchaeum ossiferum TaxID=2951803 RepID=UPI00352C4994
MIRDNTIPSDFPHPTSSKRSKQHYIFRLLISLELIFPIVMFASDIPWLSLITGILTLFFFGIFLLIPLMTQKMRKKSRIIALLISSVFILEILRFLFAMYVFLFLHGGSALLGRNIMCFSLWCLLIPSFVCNFLDVKFDFSGDFTQTSVQQQKVKFSQLQTIKIVGIITGILNILAFFVWRLTYF